MGVTAKKQYSDARIVKTGLASRSLFYDVLKTVASFEDDKSSEDVGAVFFDADNDNDLDVYVVTGGYEFIDNEILLEDKLYINDGRGYFHPEESSFNVFEWSVCPAL